MKYGFTTGSCAAAAAKAAAWMLLGGNRIRTVRIETPAGIAYEPEILKIHVGEDRVRCAVRKESGDDPDITNGVLIFAEAEFLPDKVNESILREEETGGRETIPEGVENAGVDVIIRGGEGVGVVTRPGLDQPPGNAAINSVPRTMIRNAVREVMDLMDADRSLLITISVPEGRKLAANTFNPRLGIEGGISIIGTTGIVEPMSTKALLDTIRVEVRQRKAEGADILVVSPGNYGLDFMREHFAYDLDHAVKCANYIGDTVDMAREAGFTKLLIVGHIGKLVKLSGGIMNTHSREADARMELMAASAVRCGASRDTVLAVLDSSNTEEAYRYLADAGIGEACCRYLMERISFYLNRRAGEEMNVECIMYAGEFGLLGSTEYAVEWLQKEAAHNSLPS